MDEGESGHGLIYLFSHEIHSLQYVVKADGYAVSLPGHEVLRQQESPSLGRPTRFRGTRVLPRKVFTSLHLMPNPLRRRIRVVPRIRYLFAFPQAAVLRCRYAILHAFTQSPQGTAGSL